MSSTAAEQGELPHEAAAVLAAQRAKHETDMVEAKKKFMQGEPGRDFAVILNRWQILWPYSPLLSFCSA